MILKNEYVFGCLVQFYEIEMLPEYIESCVRMLDGVENLENVCFDFRIGLQEHLEQIDWLALDIDSEGDDEDRRREFTMKLLSRIKSAFPAGQNVKFNVKNNFETFYNVAAYRRELCDRYCDVFDYVCWGETDSLWPRQTLILMETLHGMVAEECPKFVASFAGRKNWDASWDAVTHPWFRKVQFQDNEEWALGNEASEKSYMSIGRMNEINDIPLDEVEIIEMREPKADGSCLIISSELIRSGVNIPRSLIHCGEDESFLQMAKIIMGPAFRQYNFNNILRVHNRRHPNKRRYIVGENNPNGFCDDRKGRWWKVLEDASKFNLYTLRKQNRSIRMADVMAEIKQIRSSI